MSDYTFTDEEWLVYRWIKGMLGGFEESLMDTISKADDGNLDMLAKGFPMHVSAYKKYSREKGWWQSVEKKTRG